MSGIEIEYDEAKRLKILEERGIDLADAGLVFEGEYSQLLDDQHSYGETRFKVWGYLHGRRVNLVWTPRGERRRIVTMRYAHEKEHRAWHRTLD